MSISCLVCTDPASPSRIFRMSRRFPVAPNAGRPGPESTSGQPRLPLHIDTNRLALSVSCLIWGASHCAVHLAPRGCAGRLTRVQLVSMSRPYRRTTRFQSRRRGISHVPIARPRPGGLGSLQAPGGEPFPNDSAWRRDPPAGSKCDLRGRTLWHQDHMRRPPRPLLRCRPNNMFATRPFAIRSPSCRFRSRLRPVLNSSSASAGAGRAEFLATAPGIRRRYALASASAYSFHRLPSCDLIQRGSISGRDFATRYSSCTRSRFLMAPRRRFQRFL